MSFASALREKKSKLKKTSQDTYLRNIKRLRKIVGDLPIPAKDSKWLLSNKLFKWYDDQPLKVRRHMATGANIALLVYGTESKEWKSRQKKAMEQFDESVES